MIRYHSFYAAHREGDYEYLMDDHDSGCSSGCAPTTPTTSIRSRPKPKDAAALRPYYEALIAKYLPARFASGRVPSETNDRLAP